MFSYSDKNNTSIELHNIYNFKFIKHKNTKAVKYMWLLKLESNKSFLSFSQQI